MEITTYFNILKRKWWIAVPIFLVTFVVVVVFTFTQDPTYEAMVTYIVRPNSSFADVKSFTTGLDTLSRRTEIATTYTEVATSRLIKQQAADALGLTASEKRSLEITSRLRSGTNVLEIKVSGNNPELVRDFANEVGVQTATYVGSLYEAFDLAQLDAASLPTSSVKPDKKLNVGLGAGVGIVLGVAVTLFSESLQRPPATLVANFDIIDSETGVYNGRYLRQRLTEEMSRAKRNQYPLSLALMGVDNLGTLQESSGAVRSDILRRVAVLLKQHLRDEDVMARLDESVFAFMFPDTSGEEAREVMEKLQTRVAWTPFEPNGSGFKINLVSTAGVVAYNHNGVNRDQLLAYASQALQNAQASDQKKIYLKTESDLTNDLSHEHGEQ